MASPKAAGKRRRGEIETLPSGSLRVRVYGVGDGGAMAAVATRPDQPELTHQSLDRASRDRDALPVQRQPHLAGAVDPVVLRMHAADLGLELLVAQLPPTR